jgi:membrane-associated phospholipid phosphatase
VTGGPPRPLARADTVGPVTNATHSTGHAAADHATRQTTVHATAAMRAAWWCAIVCAIAFIGLACLVVSNRVTALDTRGIVALRSDASPGLTTLMLAASLTANGKVAVPLAILLAALIFRFGSRSDGLLYVGACLGGEVLHLALKAVIRHHRPVGISPKLTDAGWYSFPSGHTMLAVIIFGLAAFLLTRTSGRLVRALALLVAGALVVLVAASRVYLGAHWPSDVVGAALAGTAWTAICLWWATRSGLVAPARQSP